MEKRFKVMPKLVQHKTSTPTSPTREGKESTAKGACGFSFRDQRERDTDTQFQANPSTSSGGSNCSAIHEPDPDVENAKIPASTLAKRLDEQSLSVDLAHARYVQALFLDATMKNYVNQHKKDETTYLAQLSLLVSNLSDHLAYLERMTMAAKHQKEVKDVIRRQETCLTKVKAALEASMEPFKKLMDAIDSNRHNIQFVGICLDADELKTLSTMVDKITAVLLKLTRIFNGCNLLKSSQSYYDLQSVLQKGFDLLKQCRENMLTLENSVIETSSVRVQMLHKADKPNE